MERFGRRLLPSPSMAVALAAMVVALGGTSYAVTKIDPRSVGTKELKRNAVGKAQLKRNAVNSSKVGADALKGADVDEATLSKVPSAAAADTAALATRATTADTAGRAGASGALDRIFYRTVTVTVPGAPNATESTPGVGTARCDPGQLIVGGGVRIEEGAAMSTEASFPDGAAAWTARVNNDDLGVAHAVVVFAICIPAGAIG
jgi:hypothetical protein